MKGKLNEILNQLDIEEFKSYYSVHNIRDTAKHFNISVDRVTQISKTINFIKTQETINKQILDKNYHLNKSNLAIENSYQCIHIWDWDNIDKVINLLKPKESLYARNCGIKEISKLETDTFLDNYHLQNSCKGQTIRIGLFYKSELVQVMTFGKPRYNKNYEYELLRLCTLPKYKIIGGSKKLFKYFLDTYNPNSIISYCDNSKFKGDVYNSLGFTLQSDNKPSKHWFNMKTKEHITDNFLRQRGFDQIFNADYGKGTSNEELMKQHGFVEIYDCGQAVYVYKK